MNTGVISVRYARALLKSADKQEVKDAVYADMQSLAHNFLDVRQLRAAIDNPMLPRIRSNCSSLRAEVILRNLQ